MTVVTPSTKGSNHLPFTFRIDGSVKRRSTCSDLTADGCTRSSAPAYARPTSMVDVWANRRTNGSTAAMRAVKTGLALSVHAPTTSCMLELSLSIAADLVSTGIVSENRDEKRHPLAPMPLHSHTNARGGDDNRDFCIWNVSQPWHSAWQATHNFSAVVPAAM